MMEYFIIFVGAMLTVWLFSKAQECYHCGYDEVTKRSKYGTRGLCNRCHKSGKSMTDEA